jgi:Beta-1,3-glucanase
MSLALFLACIALGQAAAQQNNEGLAVVPLKITNNVTNTGPLFVYITGILAANSVSIPAGKAVFVTDVQGNVKETQAIPVDTPTSLGVNVGTGRSISMMMPKLVGMRIYFSLGNGLLVQTNSQVGAPPSAPCGWCGTGNTENATNFNTIYDWAELTWVDKNGGTGHETNLGGNVTEVDLFGLSLLLTLAGNDPASISPLRSLGMPALPRSAR